MADVERSKSVVVTRAGLMSALILVACGSRFVWWIWEGGGSYWSLQNPHLPLAAEAAGVMWTALAVAAAISSWIIRGALLTFALAAGLTALMGGDLMDRGRFERLRPGLDAEVAAIRSGGVCATACLIDSYSPLRIAFRLDGNEKHWNGVCFDELDLIGYVDGGHSNHPPPDSMRTSVDEAVATFGGNVHHTLHWGEHWFGCSTRE